MQEKLSFLCGWSCIILKNDYRSENPLRFFIATRDVTNRLLIRIIIFK